MPPPTLIAGVVVPNGAAPVFYCRFVSVHKSQPRRYILRRMKGIILAGGYGKRVMPLSYYKPKPMLPVANRPVVDYAVGRLAAAGITDITFALGYKPEEILDYVCGYIDLTIGASREIAPMGTAGSVKAALPPDGDEFVVLSADTLCGSDLSSLIRAHRQSGAIATMETTRVNDLGRFGAVKTENGRLIEICEKCESNFGKAGLANAGTYVFSRKVFDYVPDGRPFDFARDLFPLLLGRGEKVAAAETCGYWKDMGNLSDYYDANFEAASMYFPSARHLRPVRSRYARGSLIASSALVSGYVRDCIIGDGAIVPSSARLEKCIVLPGEYVEGNFNGCIIGRDFVLNPLLGASNLKNTEDATNIFSIFAQIKL